jgi:hypothetical protein
MPAGLVAQGRVVDQNDAKEPGASKLIERRGKQRPLERADFARGDERHGGNGGGGGNDRDIAEAAHEGKERVRRGKERRARLVCLHEGLPAVGAELGVKPHIGIVIAGDGRDAVRRSETFEPFGRPREFFR